MFYIIQDILKNLSGITDVRLGDTLEYLALDSLDTVEFIMLIERETDIDIPDELFEEFETIGDIVNYLEGVRT